MIYCSEYSLFPAELNFQEWESELLIKPFFGASEDGVGAARGMDWWFAKVPAATGFLGSIMDHVVPMLLKTQMTRDVRAYLALEFFHQRIVAFHSLIWRLHSLIWRLQTHPSVC